MQVQNSKITAPPRPLPSLKEEIRGERRPPPDGNLLRARSEKTASWSSGVIPPHPPSAPYWQTLVQPGLPHLVEHRDARSAFITRGRERNQPRLVGAPSSLLGHLGLARLRAAREPCAAAFCSNRWRSARHMLGESGMRGCW